MIPGTGFNPELLATQLADYERAAGAPSRFVIAFSGGLDSMVLAHALSSLHRSGKVAQCILAVYIDHGLQVDSTGWSRDCADSAATMGLEFETVTVSVSRKSGKGLEAAAREARYAALQATLLPGDWLLSAHHRDDQAETLLLNLIRGSGPAGLAGIGEIVRLPPGWLARPLLNFPRASLQRYAEDAGLRWIEDPSNLDRQFDRNYLRHEVLPVVEQRWPDVAERLQRSARHAGEAALLLVELAQMDFAAIGARSGRLPIDRLTALPVARQRNLIRYALRASGLTTPSTAQLQKVLEEVIAARPDAEPLLGWPGAEVRRYRNGLYLLPETRPGNVESIQFRGEQVDLDAEFGSLHLVRGAALGVSEALVARGLLIKTREGGEEFKPVGQRHTRKLKKLLQEEGVVPWMRDRLPLVYSGEQLVAVADLWLAADAVSEPGIAIQWRRRPALH